MTGTTTKILVVDDARSVCDAATQFLGELPGISVRTTDRGGLHALTMIEECPPDILFLGLRMTGIDACMIGELVSKRFGGRIQIVFLYGGENPVDLERAKLLSNSTFSGKPLVREELVETVQRVTSRNIH